MKKLIKYGLAIIMVVSLSSSTSHNPFNVNADPDPDPDPQTSGFPGSRYIGFIVCHDGMPSLMAIGIIQTAMKEYWAVGDYGPIVPTIDGMDMFTSVYLPTDYDYDSYPIANCEVLSGYAAALLDCVSCIKLFFSDHYGLHVQIVFYFY